MSKPVTPTLSIDDDGNVVVASTVIANAAPVVADADDDLFLPLGFDRHTRDAARALHFSVFELARDLPEVPLDGPTQGDLDREAGVIDMTGDNQSRDVLDDAKLPYDPDRDRFYDHVKEKMTVMARDYRRLAELVDAENVKRIETLILGSINNKAAAMRAASMYDLQFMLRMPISLAALQNLITGLKNRLATFNVTPSTTLDDLLNGLDD